MAQKEEIKIIAAHDALTKIYNFTAFCDSSRKYLSGPGKGCRMGVIYANILNFRAVNELYGLPEGDRMLGAFADFLKYLPRTRVCGRIFSDNFLCLFERTPGVDLYDEAKGFASVTERFLTQQEPFHPNTKLQIVSGVSALEDGAEGLSRAINGADSAHKVAKKGYRTACAVFDETLKQEQAREIRLLAELQAALDKKQFTFHLQPKVNLRTGRVVGAEALARWEKEDGTVAGPDNFVPLLERTGRVEQLDFLLYEQVCAFLCAGAESGDILVPVSVNVSRAHLRDERFVDKVKALLDQYGVHPSLLEFELTETMLAESIHEASAVIEGLRGIGCKVSIDDFGTGYSALNLLKDLEFDVLKLDGSFVTGDAVGYKSDVVLRAVIGMADELCMTVLCEGLETAQQVERLRSFGCTLAQGYYFARPMSAQEFVSFLRAGGGYCSLPWAAPAEGAQQYAFDYSAIDALSDSTVRAVTHTLLDVIPGGVAGIELATQRLIFANDALFGLTGYARERLGEPLCESFFERILPAGQLRYIQESVYAQLAATGRFECEYTRRTDKNGPARIRVTGTYANSPEWGRYLLCLFGDMTQAELDRPLRVTEGLCAERDFYKRLVQETPCGVMQFRVEKDGRFRTLYINGAAAHMAGYGSVEAFRAASETDILAFVHPDDRRSAYGNIARLEKAGDTRWFECRIIRQDGGVRYVEGMIQRLGVEGGFAIQVVLLDCTLRHGMHREIERHYRRLAHVMGQVLFAYDFSTDILSFQGDSGSGLKLPQNIPAFLARLRAGKLEPVYQTYAGCVLRALEEGATEVCDEDRCVAGTGGEEVWLRLFFIVLRDEAGAPQSAVGCLANVTAQHLDRVRLLHLSQTDSLTGVLNKRTVETRCRALMDGAQGKTAFAMLLLDVDDFKKLNDSQGHPAGDRALRALGECLTGLFRRDDLVGRTGGDEFIVLMPGARQDQALARAQKICREVQAVGMHSCGYPLSCSIGIAFVEAGAEYEKLLRQADVALYAAKAAGKNSVCLHGKAPCCMGDVK